MTRDLRALPKAHLHLHLEAGMRSSTLRALSDGYGVPVPVLESYGDFSVFNDTYDAALDVLRSESDVRRLVHEVVEDAAADGVVYIEPALYVPPYLSRFGTEDEIVELFLDALADASAQSGVGAALQIAGDRTQPPAECEAQARLAARFADRGVVSFGLSSDERGHPPEPFADAFAVAREAGLVSAPHAGELEGPSSIAGALDALGASRIQHGVRAVEAPDLVRRIAAEGIYLDVCPTSNILLSVFPSFGEHPLPALLDGGVRCTLNADDPLLFDVGLLDEYQLCREAMGLDDRALAVIAENSLDASTGAPSQLLDTARSSLQAWLDHDLQTSRDG
ncbi:MAG TPA: adenosine deaminase [Solirubrobacteraceae bacterium]|jgi:adenosine deaminase